MNSSEIKNSILENAIEAARLNGVIHETFKHRDEGPEKREEWRLACEEFHARYDMLSFPGGYTGSLERIAAGDAHSIEAAICFVELRPYFFRSGYMYDSLIRKLKRAAFSRSQAARFAAVLERRAAWKNRKAISQPSEMKAKLD